MLKKSILMALVITATFSLGAWAQRGLWGGCTVKNMRTRYTDQQIGGYLLHEAATLVKEASQALARVHTPEQKRLLAEILSRASRNMERISVVMGEKNLSQRDIETFHQKIERDKAKIKELTK